MVWVAIGDSITYLNEHLGEANNRITKGYMTRVVEKSDKGYKVITKMLIQVLK